MIGEKNIGLNRCIRGEGQMSPRQILQVSGREQYQNNTLLHANGVMCILIALRFAREGTQQLTFDRWWYDYQNCLENC